MIPPYETLPDYLAPGLEIVFIGSTLVTIAGQQVQAKVGFLYVTSSKQLGVLVTPPADNVYINAISISSDGSFVAWCQGGASGNDIFVSDFRGSTTVTFQATTGGKSCEPRF